MKQLVQSVDSGELRLVDLPTPTIGPTEVLVATSHSLLSSGTERAARNLASAGLLGKARARPDLVRQVLRKARTEGVVNTARAVRTRLRTDMPLGYSAAGTVIEIGEAVTGLVPGQRVATGGAGHAELQVVAAPLAVPVPEHVPFEDAAFVTVAAIAINGLRLAEVGPGARVCVIGLGGVGLSVLQAARIAGASPIIAVDGSDAKRDLALRIGATHGLQPGDDLGKRVRALTDGRGVDHSFECVGRADTIRTAWAITRRGGQATVLGLGAKTDTLSFNALEVTHFARTLRGSMYGNADPAADLPALLDHVRAGRLDLAALVSRRIALDDVEDAFTDMAAGRGARSLIVFEQERG